MKGIIFNLLQEVVEEQHGSDVWDDLLQRAGLDGAFTSLGNYPDVWLALLVEAASQTLALPGGEIVRWFGRKAVPRLALRYPRLFDAHISLRSFLMSLNEMIHPEVRKIYPGADAPDFDFAGSTADTLVMSYRSRRQLCGLAEGLIEAAPNASVSPSPSSMRPACSTATIDACSVSGSMARKEAREGPRRARL